MTAGFVCSGALTAALALTARTVVSLDTGAESNSQPAVRARGMCSLAVSAGVASERAATQALAAACGASTATSAAG